MKTKLLSMLLFATMLLTACQSGDTTVQSSNPTSSPLESSSEISSVTVPQSDTPSEVESSSIASSEPPSSVASKEVSSSKAPASSKASASSKAVEKVVPSSAPVASQPVESVAPVDVTAQYQAILDTYSEKIRVAAPILAQEYTNEAQNNTEGTLGLYMLHMNKLGGLATINVEGGEKMIEIALSVPSGKYEDAKVWCDKLEMVYMKECNSISMAHDAFGKSVNYYGEFGSF